LSGLNPEVIEMIISIISEQPENITAAVENLAPKLNVDKQLLELFIKIAICKFNPQNKDK
jgi:hypothetical protein